MRRTVIRVTLGVVGLGFLGVFGWAWFAHSAYGSARDAARAAGVAITPSDARIPDPPLGTNAGPAWRELGEILNGPMRLAPGMAEIQNYAPSFAPPAVSETATTLRVCREAVEIVHEALSKPHCVFHRNLSAEPATTYLELRSERFGAGVTCAEGRLLYAKGRPIEAARHIAKALRIARQLDEEPAILAYLVGTSTNGIAFDGLADMLLRAGTQPGVADAVYDEIERGWRPRLLRPALRVEGALSLTCLDLVRKHGTSGLAELIGSVNDDQAHRRYWTPPFWGAYVDYNGTFILRRLREIVACADLPYPNAKQAMHKIEARTLGARGPMTAIVTALGGTFEGLPGNAAADAARAAVVQAGAKVLDWRIRHRAFPASLATAMRQIPMDPFDLKPLRYRCERNGFAVWSVGRTGRFDGGKPGDRSRDQEAVFRYPDDRRPMPATARAFGAGG
jgi:hypothetical protein